ncbi:acyclic terpene utilization AtuA family protein [Tenggerimyces flavus]|uniref:Acyclic terpene utilization AtuA family protein n=1 Tax=Tenggerimyces flavus TaxID=1708749 RepID=A0ABV7YBC2_9ACTN|nr:acyclic terpene utilization AtuA family protein [Tenggerimyces flavus]MBM7789787.1 hypothetical protein [Tenggerimyces flavus]
MNADPATEDEVRIMSVGSIGAGFSYRAFKRGLEWNPHVVASDAGSADHGAASLGTGAVRSRGPMKKQLDTLITGARSIGAKFIIGSAGTAGGERNLQAVREIVEEIAQERDLHFRMALLHAELDKDFLKAKRAANKIVPLGPFPELTDEQIDESYPIVGMMGAEPFLKALDLGADVILGGRATDPAIFAGPPLRAGIPPGLAWHAARTMDKGVMMTVPGEETGSLGFIHFRKDHFVASSTKEGTYCTPRSVAAVTLYENDSPYHTIVPSGVIDTSDCTYEALDGGRVKVTGSKFQPASKYTVKLEGARFVGYRALAFVATRDPMLIPQVDDWLSRVRINAERNLHLQGVEKDDYTVRFRVYGKNGVMGDDEPIKETASHELGILIDAIGTTQEAALEAAGRHKALAGHTKFPGQLNHANTAEPFAMGAVPLGEVYDWGVWHIVELDHWNDWEDLFHVEIVDL